MIVVEKIIDREFEFYEFFFRLKKIPKKIRNFANHRCLTCFDVLECNVHL